MTDTDKSKNIIARLKEIGAITSIKGSGQFVTYEGLLMLAHENGIEQIKTELLGIDRKNKSCEFRAVASGARGIYSGHGDADPTNVGGNILPSFIRMAETRAVARALRLYLGIGMTAKNELPAGMENKKKARSPEQTLVPANQAQEDPFHEVGTKVIEAELTPTGQIQEVIDHYTGKMGWKLTDLDHAIKKRNEEGILRGDCINTLTSADIKIMLPTPKETK
jgi:hypothetical protein